MAERFTRLFQLGNDLYLDGSPVIVCAGALLNDTVIACPDTSNDMEYVSLQVILNIFSPVLFNIHSSCQS